MSPSRDNAPPTKQRKLILANAQKNVASVGIAILKPVELSNFRNDSFLVQSEHLQ